MNAQNLVGGAALVNNKLKFECTVPNRPPFAVDYAKPLGDGEGIMSLELLLLSLATCMGSTLKVLLDAQHREVQELTIQVSGNRRETHPTGFERIHLDVRLRSEGLEANTLEEILGKPRWSVG